MLPGIWSSAIDTGLYANRTREVSRAAKATPCQVPFPVDPKQVSCRNILNWIGSIPENRSIEPTHENDLDCR